jgi:Tfp pilus assembly protein PilN
MSPMSSLNFARRPFSDDRPFFWLAGLALVLAVVLLVANGRQYVAFHHEIEGTARQIASLEARRDRADHEAAEARTALNNFMASNLAQESKGLLRLVAERRFSWTALLARLERTLPADVRVTRLTPRFEDSSTYLDCALFGKTTDSVVRTIEALSRDPLFDAVDLASESVPEGTVEGYAFELRLRYRSSVPSASASTSASTRATGTGAHR